MTDEDDVVALLTARGAPAVEHPGGNLLDHLIRTSQSLRAWDAPRGVVLAGLAHAAYGTDGFDVALFSLTERDVVADAIGARAEAIVYRYASCDRAATLPQIGHGDEVAFRDRFTGSVETVDGSEVCQFAELTMANELDLVGHSERFTRQHGAALAALFAGWQDVVSPGAYDTYRRLLGPSAHAASR
jgi:hypothetical protein